MDTRLDFGNDNFQNTVYVRSVMASSLPQDIRDQLDGIDRLYAVHDSEGERLALVQDRQLAFVLARQNELTPVSAH